MDEFVGAQSEHPKPQRYTDRRWRSKVTKRNPLLDTDVHQTDVSFVSDRFCKNSRKMSAERNVRLFFLFAPKPFLKACSMTRKAY